MANRNYLNETCLQLLSQSSLFGFLNCLHVEEAALIRYSRSGAPSGPGFGLVAWDQPSTCPPWHSRLHGHPLGLCTGTRPRAFGILLLLVLKIIRPSCTFLKIQAFSWLRGHTWWSTYSAPQCRALERRAATGQPMVSRSGVASATPAIFPTPQPSLK